MKTHLRVVCALLLLTGPALAQSAPPALPPIDRLPADTWLLISWHGAASFNKVRASNPVLRLWDDPAFLSARERVVKMIGDEMERDQAKKGEKGLTKEDLDDLASALENPLVFGVAGNPFAPGVGSIGFFGVLDKTGKEALIEKMNKEDKEEKTGPNVEKSTYTFGGIEIRKKVTKKPAEPKKPMGPEEGKREQEETPQAEPKVEMSFEASLGRYELYADKQELIEALIGRFQDSSAPLVSLLTNKAYQAAQRFRAEGPLFELFIAIPDLNGAPIPIPPSPQFDFQAMLRELHVERLRALTLSTGMSADRMVLRSAMLGDTAPGSLFDLMGDNVAEFQTLAAAPSAGSYAAFRLDLAALYATLRRAVEAGLPPEQAAMAGMLDGMVAMQTGMSLTEILALIPGEVGTVSTGGENLGEVLPDLIMVPVRQGEPVLGLLRKMVGPMISAEEQMGGVTVLTISRPAPAAAAASSATEAGDAKPFYVAVAPNIVLVSQTKQPMSEVLARAAAGTPAPAGSMAADAGFQKERKTMPEKLSGLSYADMARFPWEQQREQLHKQFEKQKRETLDKADAAEKGDAEKPPDPALAASLRKSAENVEEMRRIADVLLPLMKKYLHTSAGAWWKAPDGAFLHSYIY